MPPSAEGSLFFVFFSLLSLKSGHIQKVNKVANMVKKVSVPNT